MEELGFGIIGCGVNAPGTSPGSRPLEVRGLPPCATSSQREAQEFAAKHGAPRWYVDYHEMLENPEIDVVCICTPKVVSMGNRRLRAAKAENHVLCEERRWK